MRNLICIAGGSNGEFKFNFDTGVVFDNQGYPEVTRIDVAELKIIFGPDIMKPGTYWDVIFLSHWDQQHVYYDAFSDRQTWLSIRQDEPFDDFARCISAHVDGHHRQEVTTVEAAMTACVLWESILDRYPSKINDSAATIELCVKLAPAFDRIQEKTEYSIQEVIHAVLPLLDWQHPFTIYERIEELACSVHQ